MVAVSPDRGFTRWTMTVLPGGGDRTETLGDVVNLASAAAGASVLGSTEGSLNPEALIDGTEATNWGGVTDGPGRRVEPVGRGRPRRRREHGEAGPGERLPHPGPGRRRPTSRCAQDDPDSGSRFTALRQFALEACTAGCASADATWTRFYTSPADAFPSELPRPVAPTLNMRAFDVPDTQAAAVRLVTLENQCTGQEAYAGEQTASTTDADRLQGGLRPGHDRPRLRAPGVRRGRDAPDAAHHPGDTGTAPGRDRHRHRDRATGTGTGTGTGHRDRHDRRRRGDARSG